MISTSVQTRVGFAVLILGVMFGVSSCTSPQQQKADGSGGASLPKGECYWKGDGVSGSPKMQISLSEQCVRYFKGGQLVGVSPISSGREGHSTRVGSYRILEKDFHHRSTLYGAFCDANGLIVQEDVDVRKDRAPPGTRFVGAEMRGFMRITGAVGMHEGYLPGYPASHGCIRLPGHMAEIFYRETPHGTPVQIIGDASEAVMSAPVPLAAVAPPAEKIEGRKKDKTKEKVEEKVEEETKPKIRSTSASLFGSTKKKAPKALRGQTLYLQE